MRVVLVTRGDLFPTNHGAAARVVSFAEHLSLRGDEVLLVSEDREAYLRWRAGVVSRVPYSPRARAAQEWPGLRGGARLAERICARVGYPAEEHFLYAAQFDPAFWGRVAWVARAERADVLQAEFPGYALPCAVIARALGLRSSLVQHNVEWQRLQEVVGLSGGPLLRARELERLACLAVDEVITVSADDRARLVEVGIPAAKITVIPHGVRLAAYAAPRALDLRWSLGLDPDAALLFFHGTLHYWPNTLAVRFIAEELLPRLAARAPKAHALIAGMSPPRAYEHPKLTFLGPVNDLPAAIHAADLCLCPVPSGGGTRMKLLEYFAAGKATVSFTKGAEGLRYTPGVELSIADTADTFAAEVARLLADPAARERMGAQARRLVGFYDWSQIAGRTEALYQGQGRGADYNDEAIASLRRGDAPPPPGAPPLAHTAPVDPIEAHLPPREPSKPLTLLLLINRGCNLRCAFCDLWDRGQNMPLPQVLSLLDEAVAIGTRTLVITGGEPFLHPQLFDVVRAAKARGLSVNITTNGTLVERRWAELVQSGPDSLSMSLDGLEATHDHLRGKVGAFQQTVRALGRVKDEAGITTSVYFTVTNQNVHELVPVFELSRQLRAGFDFWPVNDAPQLTLTDDAHTALYRDAVAHIGAAAPEVAARRRYYDEGLRYHAGVKTPVRCLGLIDQYGVTFEGALLPCCVWGGDGLAVGNVFETPLSTLWRSPEVQARRGSLFAEGCTVGCFNHSLYEFTRSTGLGFRVPSTT
jgi:MoaA/NifB/PqqE/SkfB family radical SAM enzyme/glycosyltransferase involved in cell wall biosynthesis